MGKIAHLCGILSLTVFYHTIDKGNFPGIETVKVRFPIGYHPLLFFAKDFPLSYAHLAIIDKPRQYGDHPLGGWTILKRKVFYPGYGLSEEAIVEHIAEEEDLVELRLPEVWIAFALIGNVDDKLNQLGLVIGQRRGSGEVHRCHFIALQRLAAIRRGACVSFYTPPVKVYAWHHKDVNTFLDKNLHFFTPHKV